MSSRLFQSVYCQARPRHASKPARGRAGWPSGAGLVDMFTNTPTHTNTHTHIQNETALMHTYMLYIYRARKRTLVAEARVRLHMCA